MACREVGGFLVQDWGGSRWGSDVRIGMRVVRMLVVVGTETGIVRMVIEMRKRSAYRI